MVPMTVEKTATSTEIPIEIWVPRSTRANVSSPAASVPKGWSQDGGCDSSGVKSTTEYFHNQPPTKASSTSASSTTRLATASRCCRKRRRTNCAWLRCATVNSLSRIPDPGIEHGIDQISGQVEQDDEGRRDQHPPRHRVDVVLRDRLKQETARPAPLVHVLGDDGPGDDRAKIQRRDRDQRDQRGAQSMPGHHRTPPQALGPGQPDIVAREHFEHGGPLEAAPGRE